MLFNSLQMRKIFPTSMIYFRFKDLAFGNFEQKANTHIKKYIKKNMYALIK